MSDFRLDADWDIAFAADGDIEEIDGAVETTQNSKFRLQIILGECFDDTRIGVPWLTDMVNPQVSIDAKKQILRNTIIQTPNAVSVDSLVISVNSDNSGLAECYFRGTSDDGEEFESVLFEQE